MKNQRRKIIAVVLLVLIVLLGGASIFVASRISTPAPVAPTAPESQPKAGVACTAPSRCQAIAACATGDTEVTGSDCSTGEKCCTPPAATWVGSTTCSFTAAISAPPCTARPACLDETPACTPAEPVGGYCPFLTCATGKTLYKNVVDNTPGTYNMLAANKLEGATAVLNPGQMYVYAINYGTATGVTSAKIVDTLDSRLTFVDSTLVGSTSTPVCTAAGQVVTCNLNAAAVGANGVVAFRVLVKETATTGALANKATISSTSTNASPSLVLCNNQAKIEPAPTIAVACKSQTALNEGGTSLISSLSKNQTYQYSFDLTNTGNTAAPNVVLKDVLVADKLIFVPSTGCTFDEGTRTVTCTTSLAAGETKKIAFTVKTSGTVVDAEVITNTATVNLATAAVGATGSQCSKGLAVALPNITASKKAYRDNTNNQAGVYQLTDEISTVAKNQTFVYSIEVKNTGTGTASAVAIADPLTGQSQDQLTLVDRDPKCEFGTAEKLINCKIDVQPGATGRIAFRVKTSDAVANGDIIKNVGKVTSLGQEITVNKDLTVSTVLGCNHTCTTDTECSSGYVCDTTSNKCRTAACASTESCVCPAAITEAPVRVVVITQAPVVEVTEKPVVTAKATLTAAPENLPETGILDIPGVAAFGGGLMLAIVGILLAL